MSKTLDVVLAGVIAGIVAYATSILGIGGTVIGAVLGAILYQVMTHIFKTPLEGFKTQNVEARIVYTFPLILIVAIEILFILALLYVNQGNFFYILENATSDNLFRSIGIGLIIMGIYPIIEHENINKRYGYIIIAVGIVKVLGGFADFNVPITDLYAFIFSELGVIISILVIAALTYVIIAITMESVTIIREKDENDLENYEKISENDVKFGERIDHWLDEDKTGNDPKLNNDDDIKKDHDMR
jgi:hypothetical protein